MARATADLLRPAQPVGAPERADLAVQAPRRALSGRWTTSSRSRASFGTTVNDVVLAVSASAMRRLFQEQGERPLPLKTMVPVNVRKPERGRQDWEPDLVHVRRPAVRRARPGPAPASIHGQTSRAQGRRRAAGVDDSAGRGRLSARSRCATRSRRSSRARCVFNLTVSNIPGPAEPMYMLGCELEEAYPVVPIAGRARAVDRGHDDPRSGMLRPLRRSRAAPDADLLAGPSTSRSTSCVHSVDSHEVTMNAPSTGIAATECSSPERPASSGWRSSRGISSAPTAPSTPLVRGRDAEEASARAQKRRSRASSATRTHTRIASSRCRADIEQPGLGLDAEAARGARRACDATSSTRAASVSFSLPIERVARRSTSPARSGCSSSPSCAGAAAGSSTSRTSRPPTSPAPTRAGSDEDQLDVGQRFRNPYEQSKFEAEKLVRAHGRPAAGPGFPPEHRRRRADHRLDRVLQRPLLAAQGVRARNASRATGTRSAPSTWCLSTTWRTPYSSSRNAPGRRDADVSPRRGRAGDQRRSPDRALGGPLRAAPADRDPAARSTRRSSIPCWCAAGSGRVRRARAEQGLLPLLLDGRLVRRTSARAAGSSRPGIQVRRSRATSAACSTTRRARAGDERRCPAPRRRPPVTRAPEPTRG